jgi:hypothetical protein
VPHFVDVCKDLSGGLPCNAGFWAGAPVLGHRYGFEIAAQSNGTWYESVRDITARTQPKTRTIAKHWSTGDGAWWGGETYDSNSMLGPTNTDTQVQMYPIEYRRVSIGWIISHPVSLSHSVIGSGSWPSWFQGDSWSHTYVDDAVNFWTNSH